MNVDTPAAVPPPTEEQRLAFWRAQLAGAPQRLELPTDRPRLATTRYTERRIPVDLGTAETHALREVATAHGVTLFTLVLAGWQLLLSRFSGQSEVVVGCKIADDVFALRTDLSGELTFASLLARVHASLLAAHTHRGVSLAAAAGATRSESHAPRFQAWFGLEGALALEGRDLALALVDGPALTGSLVYAAELFDESSAHHIVDSLLTLLASAGRAPQSIASELPLLTDAQRVRLDDFSGAAHRAAPRPSLLDQIEDVARDTPDALAVIDEHGSLTFGELLGRAHAVAEQLGARGVGPESRVALFLDRRVHIAVGMLGCWCAGAAYVPIEPAVPRARIAKIFATADITVVLTTRALAPAMDGLAVDAFALDEPLPTVAGRRHTPHTLSVAYVLFTSGSTGEPKGVSIQHGALANLAAALHARIYAGIEARHPGRRLRVSMNASYAFDSSMKQWVMLSRGHAVCVIPEAVRYDTDLFARFVREHHIDVLDCGPTQTKILLDAGGTDGVSALLVGGEAIDEALWQRLGASPSTEVWNVYGPTECTVDSTLALVEGARPTIGRAVPGAILYILDPSGRRTPPGVAGELNIGGVGLARGYLGHPELTGDCFVPDPFSRDAGARMYRTGDLARFRADGNLDYLGRIDHQVKVRGFRIELGEIESALSKVPGVRSAAVLARGEGGNRKLVGYVVGGIPTSTLRSALKETMPDYMVPTVFVDLPKMPLTTNGKIDRKALPEPVVDTASAAPPTDALEAELASIWTEVLGIRSVGADDDFFEVGGHSLAAMAMLAEVKRRVGKSIPNHVLFHSPTIASMASYIRSAPDQQELRSLVPIQPLGTRPPLFLVHGGGGEVFFYRDLARRLGTEQPVYGLQARREDDGTVQTRTVEDMAYWYLKELRVQQPVGPYWIGGMSFGGKVALEMAQRLRDDGQEVALLCLFDTWGPGYPRVREDLGVARRSAYWLYQRLGHHIGSVRLLEPERRLPYLREKAHRVWLETKWAFEDLGKELQKKAITLMGKEPAPNAGKTISFIAAAIAVYEPRVYDGHAVLFRSRDQPLDVYPDRTLGWRPFITGLEVCELPGIHATMTAEPRVRYLVEALQPMLERTQRKHAK